MEWFKRLLVEKFSSFLFYYHLDKLKQIRKLPNVFIEEGVMLGDQSAITVQGVCKQLKIEQGVSSRRFCSFLVFPDAELIIRPNVFFNNCCSVNCLGRIEIGENTLFGEGVKMYDHNHLYDIVDGNINVARGDFKIGEIKIGKNCWIGSNTTILNNVEIGDNVIIGANNLIYKNIKANTIIVAKSEIIAKEH